MFYSTLVAFSLLATQQLVAGHGAIVNAVGDAGGQGSAIGVDPSTPRDGTGRNPFQQDSTRFRGDAADSCGETLGGGTNNVETGTQEVMSQNGDTLPQITPGGELQMTVHQVNADGAGPYSCEIDATGAGTNWQTIQVTQNLPGNERGRNRETNETPQPLTAAIPAGQECTGTVAGQENVCMVRCMNPARAGPFGGCVPVQMAGAGNATAGAAAGNANANANANGNANNNANANNANGNANNANANANANNNNANANNGNGNANNAASNNRANNNNAANNNNNNAAAADEDAAGANDRKLRRSAKFLFDRQSRKDAPLQPFEIEEEAEELDEE